MGLLVLLRWLLRVCGLIYYLVYCFAVLWFCVVVWLLCCWVFYVLIFCVFVCSWCFGIACTLMLALGGLWLCFRWFWSLFCVCGICYDVSVVVISCYFAFCSWLLTRWLSVGYVVVVLLHCFAELFVFCWILLWLFALISAVGFDFVWLWFKYC